MSGWVKRVSGWVRRVSGWVRRVNEWVNGREVSFDRMGGKVGDSLGG